MMRLLVGLDGSIASPLELLKSLKLIGIKVTEDQLDVIKRIYQSHFCINDCSDPKPELDRFFSSLTRDDVLRIDMSTWSFDHLMAWFYILDKDLFKHKNNDKAAYFFAARVNGHLLTYLTGLPYEGIYDVIDAVSLSYAGVGISSKYGSLDCWEFDKLVADCYQITEEEAAHVMNF